MTNIFTYDKQNAPVTAASSFPGILPAFALCISAVVRASGASINALRVAVYKNFRRPPDLFSRSYNMLPESEMPLQKIQEPLLTHIGLLDVILQSR
jgi:hypothetical protein